MLPSATGGHGHERKAAGDAGSGRTTGSGARHCLRPLAAAVDGDRSAPRPAGSHPVRTGERLARGAGRGRGSPLAAGHQLHGRCLPAAADPLPRASGRLRTHQRHPRARRRRHPHRGLAGRATAGPGRLRGPARGALPGPARGPSAARAAPAHRPGRRADDPCRTRAAAGPARRTGPAGHPLHPDVRDLPRTTAAGVVSQRRGRCGRAGGRPAHRCRQRRMPAGQRWWRGCRWRLAGAGRG